MSRAKAEIHSSEAFGEFDEFHDEKVLDMMATGLSAPQLLRHLEVISAREFEYETMTMVGINPEGEKIEYANEGRSLAMEAFMEEAVVIQINETTDEKASPIVFVGINGDQRWLPRGVPIRLPRKFVERLAQSAERSFATPKIAANDNSDNERPVKIKSTQAYPFSVLRDSHVNPRLARAWLLRVTKQST